jgi:hypothetical protein
MMKDNWLQTDEADDVAGSVRHALQCLEMVGQDKQAWKWFVLALHSAIQGACVCNLVSTASPVGAVYPENATKFINYFEESRTNPDAKPPEARIMALPDLLKAVRKPNSAGDRSNNLGISITDGELEWLGRFHTIFRNQFVHFDPMGWSLEISGLPAIGRLVARILSDILNAGWAFRHKDHEWKEALQIGLQQLANCETPSS